MQYKSLFAQLFASNTGGKIFLGILAVLAIIVPPNPVYPTPDTAASILPLPC